jgi:hypothetical protein
VDRLKLPPLMTLLAAMHGGGGLCLVREWQRLYDSIAFESCLSFAQGDRRTVSLCVCCILRFPADSVFCSGIPRCPSLSLSLLAQGDRRTVSNDTQILKFSLGDAFFGLVHEDKLEGAPTSPLCEALFWCNRRGLTRVTNVLARRCVLPSWRPDRNPKASVFATR